MRFLKVILVFSLFGSVAFAAKTPDKDGQLETDISFEDMLVKGKYHFNDEAVVTVEQDKVLDGLLGIRRDFRDKIQRSATRY